MKELLEKRMNLVKQARAILDGAKKEERGLSAEERNKYDAIDKDIDALNASIEAERKLGDLESRMDEVVDKKVETGEVEHPDEFRAYLRGDIEARALGTGSDAAGGAMVPEELAKAVVMFKQAASPVRVLADVITTSGEYSIPVVSSVGSASLVSENTATAITAVDPVTAKKALTGYLAAWNTDVSVHLAQDLAFNLEAVLSKAWGMKVGELEESYFCVGTGSSQPEGLTAGGTAGVTAAATGAVTADELINLFYALGSQYRKNGSWIFADSTIKAIRKLKNSTTGDYLWSPALVQSEPDSLMGRPLYASSGMAAMGASNKFGVFGDLSYFSIVDRGAMNLIVDPYTSAGKGQIRYIGQSRFDSAVTLAAAVQYITSAAS